MSNCGSQEQNNSSNEPPGEANTREFDTLVVLSAATGIMACQDFGDIQEFFEWYLGYPVWTHQLPRVFEEESPELMKLFPEFSSVDFSGCNKDDFFNWSRSIKEQLGEYRTVKQKAAPPAAIEPISELVSMVGVEKVVPVTLPVNWCGTSHK